MSENEYDEYQQKENEIAEQNVDAVNSIGDVLGCELPVSQNDTKTDGNDND